jgi:hypothetical protein
MGIRRSSEIFVIKPDSEVGAIGLVLVVLLVLDLWDFGAEKIARSLGNYFVPSLREERRTANAKR